MSWQGTESTEPHPKGNALTADYRLQKEYQPRYDAGHDEDGYAIHTIDTFRTRSNTYQVMSRKPTTEIMRWKRGRNSYGLSEDHILTTLQTIPNHGGSIDAIAKRGQGILGFSTWWVPSIPWNWKLDPADQPT